MRNKFLLGASIALLAMSSAQAGVFTFESGNGSVWGPDAVVRFKPWQNTEVPNFPETQDFADVRTVDTLSPKSHTATIAPAETNGWSAEAASMNALPVFNFVAPHVYGVGSSALFGIPIEVTDADVHHAANLHFEFIADNYLGFDDGDTYVEGLWLGLPGDEQALANTADWRAYDPEDRENTRFASGTFDIDVSDIVVDNGTYWLYMNVTDRGIASSGILFSGQIVTHNPEPGTILIWSLLGASVFGVIRWRKRSK
jgi:hypothetical protein